MVGVPEYDPNDPKNSGLEETKALMQELHGMFLDIGKASALKPYAFALFMLTSVSRILTCEICHGKIEKDKAIEFIEDFVKLVKDRVGDIENCKNHDDEPASPFSAN